MSSCQPPTTNDQHRRRAPPTPAAAAGGACRRARVAIWVSAGAGGRRQRRCRPTRRSSPSSFVAEAWRRAVGALHLLAQRLPDLVMELEEARLEADLLHRAARARADRCRRRALTVPGPAVSTTTRSASATASSRSWVTKRTDGRVCSHSPSSSFDMIALVCTSSAPNGSSISRIDGSLISAAARPRACACRPTADGGSGPRSRTGPPGAASPGRWRAPASSRTPAEHRAQRHVAEHRLPRQQRVGLEHEARAAGDPVDRAGRRRAPTPALGRSRPETMRQRRRLAAAGRPDDGAELARLDRRRSTSRSAVNAAPRRGDEPLGHAAQSRSSRPGWAPREHCRPTPPSPVGRLAYVLATVIGLLSHSVASVCLYL